MDIAETLEAVREIDRLTKENPSILLIVKELKEQKNNVLPIVSDAFVSQKMAAKILGTSPATLCRFVNEGLLDCWILPGQSERRYKLSDLQNFMNTKCTKGGKAG